MGCASTKTDGVRLNCVKMKAKRIEMNKWDDNRALRESELQELSAT